VLDHIIAAYDRSEGARDALALATVLADAAPDGPGLLTVATAFRDMPVDDPARAADWERLAGAAAEERLRPARALVGDRARTDLRVVHGSSPADGLHRLAQELGASCIVVGTSHTGPLGRVLPGSVTEQVLQGSPCAVAVAPAGYADEDRVVRTVGVAYDDSVQARRALEIAAELARRFGARLRVIRVLDEQVVRYGGYAGEAALEGLREAARQRLSAAAETVEGVGTETLLLEGSVPVRLGAASADVDLLVVGSRGNGPVRRVLLGSVSSRLARQAACPLIAVPRTGDGTAPAADS
jgi:nucleotide-binding universal stress UspA family protein